MYKAQLYSKYNALTVRDATYVLNKFRRLLKWQPNEKILDIGCGDGKVTLEVLLPCLPKKFDKLIGGDLSIEMVKFAQESTKNPKVSFRQFDISTKNIPKDFKQGFHHIFSFYCLHWIQNQQRVFQNIYDMLKPGGAFLVAFLACSPYFEIYERMVKSSKWAPYMKNIDQYISPYQHSEDAGKEMKRLLNQLGFAVHYCEAEKLAYDYPSFGNLKNLFSAINPFMRNIPNNEIEDYLADFCSEIRKLDSVIIKPSHDNKEEVVCFLYKLLIAYAIKPL